MFDHKHFDNLRPISIINLMDKRATSLIKKINQLTKCINIELIALALSLSSFIAGVIIWFTNWRVGHENAEEAARMNNGTNIFLISSAIVVALIISLIFTTIIRKNKKDILIKYFPLAISRIQKPSVTTIIIVSIPACIIIVTLLVFLVSSLR